MACVAFWGADTTAASQLQRATCTRLRGLQTPPSSSSSSSSSPCNESSTSLMHRHVAAVAPLATAGWLTSMQNTWMTGCGARTMYSLVAAISYVPQLSSGRSYASRRLHGGHRDTCSQGCARWEHCALSINATQQVREHGEAVCACLPALMQPTTRRLCMLHKM